MQANLFNGIGTFLSAVNVGFPKYSKTFEAFKEPIEAEKQLIYAEMKKLLSVLK